MGDLGVEALHVSEVVAVLAAQVAQLLTPGPDRGQPLGIGDDAVRRVADGAGDVVELGEHGLEALDRGPVGRSVAQSSGGGSDRVPPPAVTGEHLVGGIAGETVLLGVGQRVLLHLQHGLLVRVVDGGGVELGDLEPGEVEFACAGSFVAAERGQLGVELGQPGARGAQRGEVDAGEGVERPPLRRR